MTLMYHAIIKIKGSPRKPAELSRAFVLSSCKLHAVTAYRQDLAELRRKWGVGKGYSPTTWDEMLDHADRCEGLVAIISVDSETKSVKLVEEGRTEWVHRTLGIA